MRAQAMFLCVALLFFSSAGLSQTSDRTYRRVGFLERTHIRTVFGNWNVIGQPPEFGRRGSWMSPDNGYVGDASFMVALELPIRDWNGDGHPDTVHPVIVSSVNRPQMPPRSEDPITGKPWGFEPLPGFFAPDPNQSPAVSIDPATWPTIWPDHPEYGPGVWNGLYGPNVFVGDAETYYVVDDQNDENFSFAANNSRGIVFRPDTTDPSRLGEGIRVSVRYIIVEDPAFRDVLFRVFDIKNEGTYRYSKVVFAALTGTYIGCTSTENSGEYDDDATVYFPSSNSIIAWDFDNNALRNPLWHGAVGRFGETFIQSPTQNRIASSSIFAPANNISFGDDEGLWSRLLPGLHTHPPSIVNDTVATRGEDSDFLYGSDFFALDPGQTQRIASVIAYGYSKNEVLGRIALAKALWNAHFDTTLVHQAVTITNFSSHRILSGDQPIEWSSLQSGGSVDVWFSPDLGRNWTLLAGGIPNTGSYLWNTGSVEDCAFGLLRMFISDTAGNVYGFSESPRHFTVNNAGDGTPFVGILNRELTPDTTIQERSYDFRLLAGDPEFAALAMSVFYRLQDGGPYLPVETFQAPTDTNEQIHTLSLFDLPNSDHFTLKFVASDGNTSSSDTVAFRKQSHRNPIPPSSFEVLSGFAEVMVQINIVDSARLRPDTYIMTFDDTSSGSEKLFSVFNQTQSLYTIHDASFSPGIESEVFDGLTLLTEDTVTAMNATRSHWNANQQHQYSFVPLDVVGPSGQPLRGYRNPFDYSVVFHDTPADTSVQIDSLGLVATPVNFQIFSAQSSQRIHFGIVDFGSGIEIVLLEDICQTERFTWDLLVQYVPPGSPPHEGDTLYIYTKKGLSLYDSLRISNLPVSVQTDRELPSQYRLEQNFPNPFNSSTQIQFQIPFAALVQLKIFDILGREVETLVNGVLTAGSHAATWRALEFASGVYFYRLQVRPTDVGRASSYISTKKLVLLK